MKYNKQNVEAGDFVKIHAEDGEPYLKVISTYSETFDVRTDYGMFYDVPYEDILDLKLESEYFKVAGL